MMNSEPVQGSTIDYCEGWPEEGHSWIWTKHAGLPVVATEKCSRCGYLNVSEVQARIAALEAERDAAVRLAETCRCSAWPPEGPAPDCPVHGAVRALNEATAELAELAAERDRMRPVVEAARAIAQAVRQTSEIIGLPPREGTWRADVLAAVDAFESGPHNTGSEAADG